MNIVALSHGYPPFRNMGGEVSLHRSLVPLVAAGHRVAVLTRAERSYRLDGVDVFPIALDDVFNLDADPGAVIAQLRALDAQRVIGVHDLSYLATRAAAELDVPSIVTVHAPPKYGAALKRAVHAADSVVYNTSVAAKEWGEPRGFVLHPPASPLPEYTEFKEHVARVHAGTADAYTLLSNLWNKGVTVALELAREFPDRRFIIVRSPAEDTHGIDGFDRKAAELPNVEVHPRVDPQDVATTYLSETRLLLVPSKYETYGMSAVEAAGYGIPSVHVDTPHVREGIGAAAVLIPPLNTLAAIAGIHELEQDYDRSALVARLRAESLARRQERELAEWVALVESAERLTRSAAAIRRAGLEAFARQSRRSGYRLTPEERERIASHTRPSRYTKPTGWSR